MNGFELIPLIVLCLLVLFVVVAIAKAVCIVP